MDIEFYDEERKDLGKKVEASFSLKPAIDTPSGSHGHIYAGAVNDIILKNFEVSLISDDYISRFYDCYWQYIYLIGPEETCINKIDSGGRITTKILADKEKIDSLVSQFKELYQSNVEPLKINASLSSIYHDMNFQRYFTIRGSGEKRKQANKRMEELLKEKKELSKKLKEYE